MILVCFDTATPTGGVALLRDGVIEGEVRLNQSGSHSRFCLRQAEQLLAAAGLGWNQVEVFASTQGPGAFVGVRIGLTLAKGLAFARGRRVIAVNSLEAQAWQAWDGVAGRLVVPLIDARVGEVYGAVFEGRAEGLVRIAEDFCAPPAAAAERIPAGSLLAGEGALRYREFFAGKGDVARGDRLRASPAAAAWLAWQEYQRSGGVAPGEVRAIYLREATTRGPASQP